MYFMGIHIPAPLNTNMYMYSTIVVLLTSMQVYPLLCPYLLHAIPLKAPCNWISSFSSDYLYSETSLIRHLSKLTTSQTDTKYLHTHAPFQYKITSLIQHFFQVPVDAGLERFHCILPSLEGAYHVSKFYCTRTYHSHLTH